MSEETKVEKKKLSPLATVIITIIATLAVLVIARGIYFMFTGV